MSPRLLKGVVLLGVCAAAPGVRCGAQATPVDDGGAPGTAADITVLPSGVGRLAGTHSGSGTKYVRYFLHGKAEGNSVDGVARQQATEAFDTGWPTAIAQCTLDAKNKLHFELFFHNGDVSDTRFYPPWQASAGSPFPQRQPMVLVTMEFLGYTKYKPVKRTFEQIAVPVNTFRYMPPGMGSANMEEIAWYFQVLRALPTLRLTANGKSWSFDTAPLQAQLQRDPLCKASGL